MQSIPSTIYNKVENSSVLSSATSESVVCLLLKGSIGEGSGSHTLILLSDLYSASSLIFCFEVLENLFSGFRKAISY